MNVRGFRHALRGERDAECAQYADARAQKRYFAPH